MVALAEAYFDDSGAPDEPFPMCLGGYVFKPGMANALAPEWKAMLDLRGLDYFRMSECAHGEGQFARLSAHERDEVAREAIALTIKYADRGVAISIDAEVAADMRGGSIWGNTYSFLCGQTVFAIQQWAHQIGFDGDVAYFFESGTKGYAQAIEALGLIQQSDGERKYRIGSVALVDKKKSAAVQCADLIAWHWLQQNKRWAAGKSGRRADFKALSNGVFVQANHYDRAALEFLQAMRAQQA